VLESYILKLSLQVVNDHLLKDLTDLGLWNADMKNRLMYENGSIQVRADRDRVSSSFVFESFRILRVFLIISKHCIKQCGKFLKRRLSTWPQIGVLSSINLNR
jgi:hypothetical protein